jgi:hypothetical protein
MIQARYFAMTVTRVGGSDEVRAVKTETPEFDKAWAQAYVADRRRRGVSPLGTVMGGERVSSGERVELGGLNGFCKRGHEMTPENTYTMVSSVTGKDTSCCRACRSKWETAKNAARREARAAAKPAVAVCRAGHELTPENSMANGHQKDGTPKRMCRTCRNERKNVTKLPSGQRTHCPQWHEYTEENTYIAGDGHRECRTCRRDQDRERRAARARNPARALAGAVA